MLYLSAVEVCSRQDVYLTLPHPAWCIEAKHANYEVLTTTRNIHIRAIYTVSPKNVHLFIFQLTVKNKPILMIFGVWNPEKIWHQQLIHLPTLPVYCNHFTLGNPEIQIIYLISEETNCNCCTVAYLFTYCCLLLPIICFVLFYGHFYLFGQSFPEPPMPTHNRLFSVTNIWRNPTLPAVRCKSFTFYKVVWWHFSGVVGKGVTVCFLLR